MDATLKILIFLALGFDFLNGIHDSSNIVATMISSRALSPRQALTLTAIAEFSGPFIFGVAVAKTIGDEIVLPGTISMVAIIAALIGAILWNLLTWFLGMPSSSSHALIGGLLGAVIMDSGWEVIKIAGVEKVFIALFTSPIIGFAFGFIVTQLIRLACWKATPKVNWIFKKGQIVTAVALALSHGANDAQKSMGIITLGLVTSGYLTKFNVPTWVIFICASMIALGTSVGGWKLIKTLGAKFYRIRPIDGFSAQLSSTIVILGASLFGGPVSTTQVVSTAIMGVGSAERANKVRWGVASEIAIAWLLTIPATTIAGAGMYWLITNIIL
ncbi:MAG: inorganic phosphate transporter [Anaerolineaceae bacterium]|nr:inorganic phosphate transporter [Anaerolineaceae bacterium]